MREQTLCTFNDRPNRVAHLWLMSVALSICLRLAGFSNGVFNEGQVRFAQLALLPKSRKPSLLSPDRSLWPRNKHKLPVICELYVTSRRNVGKSPGEA